MDVRRLDLVAVVAVGLAAFGCTHSTEPEAELELGTGEWRFEELGAEQPVPLIRGSQGGHHVWLSLRTRGLECEGVEMSVETQLADGSRPVEESRVRVDLSLDDRSEQHVLLGWPAVLARPACFLDRPVRIRVELADTNGASASDERIVIPQSSASLVPCE